MVFEDYVKMVEEKKMSVGVACKELGISRQTWYNWRNSDGVVKKSGRPRKAEKIDWAKVMEQEKAEQMEWIKSLDRANEKIAEFLNQMFPHMWCNLRFEHVDASAYWFTFELVNDDRRQTWCVRHSDLEEKPVPMDNGEYVPQHMV